MGEPVAKRANFYGNITIPGGVFDGSNPNYYDGILLIEDKKFYILKGHLAQHSEFFDILFFNEYKEKNQEEIRLEDVDADDFLLFLKLINGHRCLTDDNLKDLLNMSGMFLAPVALERCEHFLAERSKMTKRMKMALAIQYRFHELKKSLISETKTCMELASICPQDISRLDDATRSLFLQKFLDISKTLPAPVVPMEPRAQPIGTERIRRPQVEAERVRQEDESLLRQLQHFVRHNRR